MKAQYVESFIGLRLEGSVLVKIDVGGRHR
jgi:hypothetical protein